MSWFKRDKSADETVAPAGNGGERKVRTEGLWQKCEGCRQIIWKKDLESNSNVCPKCGHHFRIDATARSRCCWTANIETFDQNLAPRDPLGFVDTKPYQRAPGGHAAGHRP